jgi:hypothetical protein
MSRAQLAAGVATALAVLGMWLVVAGVLVTGPFIPGVLLIIAAAIGYAAAGVLALLDTRAARP